MISEYLLLTLNSGKLRFGPKCGPRATELFKLMSIKYMHREHLVYQVKETSVKKHVK